MFSENQFYVFETKVFAQLYLSILLNCVYVPPHSKIIGHVICTVSAVVIQTLATSHNIGLTLP